MHLNLTLAIYLVELGPVLEIVGCFLGHVCLIFNHLIDPVTDPLSRLVNIKVFLTLLLCVLLGQLGFGHGWRSTYYQLFARGHIFVRRRVYLQDRATTLRSLAIRLLLRLLVQIALLVVSSGAPLQLLLGSHANRLLRKVLQLGLVCILDQTAIPRVKVLPATTARDIRSLPDWWKYGITAAIILLNDLIFKAVGTLCLFLLDIDEAVL